MRTHIVMSCFLLFTAACGGGASSERCLEGMRCMEPGDEDDPNDTGEASPTEDTDGEADDGTGDATGTHNRLDQNNPDQDPVNQDPIADPLGRGAEHDCICECGCGVAQPDNACMWGTPQCQCSPCPEGIP